MLDLQEVKTWLRVDGTEDDATITMLVDAAETYLKNATGRDYNSKNSLAKLYCMVLVADWYENRELVVGSQPSDKVRFTIQSMTAQLQYAGDPS